MNSELSQFLTALFADSFDVVKLKTMPPRNESNPLNTPFLFNDIKRGELTDNFSLATKSLRISNDRKNILLDCSGIAACVVIGDLDALDGFDCPPSAIVSAGNLYWVIWFLADEFDFEPWQSIQSELAAKFGGKTNQFAPLPSFNLVKFDAETGNYTYEPIQLHSICPHNRYDADALLNAAIITESGKSAERKSAERSKSAERKSAVTGKGELTYTNFVRLIGKTMKSAEIIKSAETNLGLKTRRSEALLKSAVTRNDVVTVKRGVYAPKSAEMSEGLPLAA